MVFYKHHYFFDDIGGYFTALFVLHNKLDMALLET